MRILIAFFSALLVVVWTVAARADAKLIPANTKVVIAGVLQFLDPDIVAYPVEKRKDAELDRVLKSVGVPDQNRKLILDEAATAKGIHQAVVETVKSSKPGETFLFYYAGHGSISTGRLIMTSFDADTRKKTRFRGYKAAELEKALIDHWKGNRVILMGDFCYSGSFSTVAKNLRAKGIDAVSLTSASQSNQSTGSWSYTQSIIDGIKGRPLVDLNQDGKITLAELAHEVQTVMRTREAQKAGFDALPADRSLVVSFTDKPLKRSLPRNKTRYRPGDWACTPAGASRVLSVKGSQVTTESYYFNEYRRRTDDARFVVPFKLQRWPAGAAVDVLYDGKQYAAKITERKGDFHKITYPGWDSSWDEWITSDRIVRCRDAPKQKIEVKWEGKWYGSEVLCDHGGQTLIKYSGYTRCWNEWVTAERVRRPRGTRR